MAVTSTFSHEVDRYKRAIATASQKTVDNQTRIQIQLNFHCTADFRQYLLN